MRRSDWATLFWLVALACCPLAASLLPPSPWRLVQAEPPANITIGMIAGFTRIPTNPTRQNIPYVQGVHRNLSVYNSFGKGSDQYVAARYQMELINARSDLLPQTLLTSRVYDDQFDQQRGFLGALENVQAGARILLGGSSSGSAASAAFVAQTFDTALLSWAASSPTLADKRQYPNFLRVCQNDASQAVAMAWMTRYHFGWDRVAIMYTNDLYGSSGASAFVNSAQDFNISIITQQGFAMGAIDADITPPLMRVKTSRARIIIFFGQYREWGRLARLAQASDMFNNQTAWFLSDAVPGSLASFTDAAKQSWNGVIAIAPDGGSQTQAFKDYFTGFLQRPRTHILEEEWSGQTMEDVNFYMGFAVDSVTVLATALHELINVQGLNDSWTSTQLFAQIQQTDLRGITGPIRFDSNFDRIGISFQILNSQGASFRVMGEWQDDAYTPFPQAGEFIWIGGSTEVPKARAPVPLAPVEPLPTSLLNDNSYKALIIVPSILLAFIVALASILYKFRTSRVIHAASPVMLGLVLLGGALVCVSVMISAFPQDTSSCTVRSWLFNLGFTLSFGSLFLRTYRVHKIFNNENLVITTFHDAVLFKMLAGAIGLECVVLALRTGIAPYRLDEYGSCDFEDGMPHDAGTALNIILIVSGGLMIVAAAYLSYAVRNLPQLYNESSYLAVAIYNILLLSAAWVGVRYGVDLDKNHPDSATIFDSAIMLACCTLTLMIVFLPKLYDVFHLRRAAAFHTAVRKKAGQATAGGAQMKASGGVSPVLIGENGSTPTPPRSTVLGGAIPSRVNSLADILNLLQNVQADAQQEIEMRLGEIKRLEDAITAKKSSIHTSTELLFQVNSEIDYFHQMRQQGGQDAEAEMLAVFDARLAEFGAIDDANEVKIEAVAGGARGGADGGIVGVHARRPSLESGTTSPKQLEMVRRQVAVYGGVQANLQNSPGAGGSKTAGSMPGTPNVASPSYPNHAALGIPSSRRMPSGTTATAQDISNRTPSLSWADASRDARAMHALSAASGPKPPRANDSPPVEAATLSPHAATVAPEGASIAAGRGLLSSVSTSYPYSDALTSNPAAIATEEKITDPPLLASPSIDPSALPDAAFSPPILVSPAEAPDSIVATDLPTQAASAASVQLHLSPER